jgi:2-polyprenyl-6-methoxyphenol hydroxylase-like FAD-dependent oxidoreductase
MAISSIIIIGAGPSGLLLALLLSQLTPRPQITIFDSAPTLNDAPRATHYGPPAIRLFRKAGILEEIRRDGYMPTRICYRKLNGERICGYDRSLMHDEGLDGDGLTVYWVGRLCRLLEREMKRRVGISVRWGCRAVALPSGLDAKDLQASVEVTTSEGQTEKHTAEYIIGCDGGNSTIRRLMHGPRNFPGFSWDVPIVATNTLIDLDRFGWEDTQFIIDPEHWYMAARIGPHQDPEKNVWRISYGEKPGLANEELMARQEMKFEQMLPGNPKPTEYRVLSKSPYRVHQRCVPKMRIGRVLLAADAAHLCNPFGGLGLTGGIVDVGALVQCLEGIHYGLASDGILNVYCEVQRRKWHEIINPVSTANILRMMKQDPETAMEEDEVLKLVKKAETDEELSRELQSQGLELLYDYTQHYERPGKGGEVKRSRL